MVQSSLTKVAVIPTRFLHTLQAYVVELPEMEVRCRALESEISYVS